MASKGGGDAYTFELKYPLGDDPSAVNAKTDAVKTMLANASFPTNYAARVPSGRRLREIDGRSTGDIREIARPRRRLITVSGVDPPVAALDAEVVIVVEVLAPGLTLALTPTLSLTLTLTLSLSLTLILTLTQTLTLTITITLTLTLTLTLTTGR